MRARREAGVHPARLRLAAVIRVLVEPVPGRGPDIATLRTLAAAAGVTVRQVRDAMQGRAVAADAFLGLAWVVGLDTASGRALFPSSPAARPGRILWWLVQGNVVLARAARGLSLRDAAAEIGIGHVTLDRAEKGVPLSADTLLRVAAWLGMPARHLTDTAPCFRVAPARRARAAGAERVATPVPPPVSRETGTLPAAEARP